jgi:hypothetical protein
MYFLDGKALDFPSLLVQRIPAMSLALGLKSLLRARDFGIAQKPFIGSFKRPSPSNPGLRGLSNSLTKLDLFIAILRLNILIVKRRLSRELDKFFLFAILSLNSDMKFGERIKKLREERGLSL